MNFILQASLGGIIMFIILFFIILLLAVAITLPYLCNIHLDTLEIVGLEKDLGRFNHSFRPKQHIHHRGRYVATIFLN